MVYRFGTGGIPIALEQGTHLWQIYIFTNH